MTALVVMTSSVRAGVQGSGDALVALDALLLAVGLACWWFLPTGTPRRGGAGPRRARRWGRRWWYERGTYAVGFFFAFWGLTRLWDALGWWRALLVALAVVVALLVAQVVVLVVRAVPRGNRGAARKR